VHTDSLIGFSIFAYHLTPRSFPRITLLRTHQLQRISWPAYGLQIHCDDHRRILQPQQRLDGELFQQSIQCIRCKLPSWRGDGKTPGMRDQHSGMSFAYALRLSARLESAGTVLTTPTKHKRALAFMRRDLMNGNLGSLSR
jgi:hypothetical protein